MRLCVITPNDEYLGQAGARIRYQRLAEALRRSGHDLALRPLARVAGPPDLTDDVYLLSKCHDARALLLAHEARELGKRVGIDLFDDYFSQGDDSRFSRLRAWFHAAAGSADFVLCSTPAMQAVARRCAPHLPSHVMNDPFDRFDRATLLRLLAEKRDRVAATRVMEVAWFGTGDNPHFPVGLADVTAFADALPPLASGGLAVTLRILTNPRAMTVDALAALARLPVRHAIETWSEAGEAALLKQCYAAFLPVNAQPFSVAKSLNRAVTALNAGAQVLSAGYPLYAAFSDFLYRDPTELAHDAGVGQARLRPETLDGFARRLHALADPEREAADLLSFFSTLPETTVRGGRAPYGAAIVHGRESAPHVHTFARSFGALSVASPLVSQPLDYDVRIVAAQDGFDVLVHSRRAADLSRFPLVPTDGTYLKVLLNMPGDPRALDLCRLSLPGLQDGAHAAAHGPVMAEAARILNLLFPGLPLIPSEDFRMAWPVPAGFSGRSSFGAAPCSGHPVDAVA